MARRLAAEVVVVGSGPMGIVVALELADAGHRVLLVESGGPTFDQTTQDLSRRAGEDPGTSRAISRCADSSGARRPPGVDAVSRSTRSTSSRDPASRRPVASRIRRDGALSGTCLRLVPVRATGVQRAASCPELAGRRMIPGFSDGDVLTTSLERWSLPTTLRPRLPQAREAAQRLELITGLTCTHIACDPGVRRGGPSPAPVARRAPGDGPGPVATCLPPEGLEATRLLMPRTTSTPTASATARAIWGAGTWHTSRRASRRVHLKTPPESTIHEHERDADGVYVRRRFTFSPEFQRRKGLANGAMWFVNPPMGDPVHGSGILSGVYLTLVSPVGRFMLAEAIRQAGTKTSEPVRKRDHVRNIFRDLGAATRFALGFSYRRFLKPGRKAPGFFVRSAANIYPLDYHGEHLPNADSRVVLTSERDELGVPRIRTEMTFSDEDVASVERAMRELDASLRDADVGHLEFLFDDIAAGVRECLVRSSGFHQTGTTRMAATADRRRCRREPRGVRDRQPLRGEHVDVPDFQPGKSDLDGDCVRGPARRASGSPARRPGR